MDALQEAAQAVTWRAASQAATWRGWLEFDVARCDPQFDIDLLNLGYKATANGMLTLQVFADGSSIETTYLRQ